MNSSDQVNSLAEMAATQTGTATSGVLAREAGIPFQPPVRPLADADPFVEWLSLMELAQTLCPVWPVRDKPMQGTHWLI